MERRDLKSIFVDAEHTGEEILSPTAAPWRGVPVGRGGGGSLVPLKL